MPLPREGKVLDYSRWQQNLIGILQTDIAFNENVMLEPRATVTIDARMAYRNKGEPDGNWKHYSSSLEKRELDCSGNDVSFHEKKFQQNLSFSNQNLSFFFFWKSVFNGYIGNEILKLKEYGK